MTSSAHSHPYTVIVRLPFDRQDFIDPPQVEWDTRRDKELWDILSRSSAKENLDWGELATRFNVDLSFLTQQAAWLYEKQLSQVRAQLRKANQSSPVNASPANGSLLGTPATLGGQPMSRGGSAGSRTTSALSHRARERTLSHEENGSAGAVDRRPPRGSTLSRKSSTNTVTRISTSVQAQHSPPDGQVAQGYRRPSRESSKRSIESSPKIGKPLMERISSSSAVESSSSESDREPPISRSRTFTRRPRYAPARSRLNALSDADEEDDAAPFLPFSTKETTTAKHSNSTAESKSNIGPRALNSGQHASGKGRVEAMQTIDSSSSSSVSHPRPKQSSPPSRPSTLSPKHRRLLKEAGSDGALSMGSSFSDLDDASVTQSALEDAMAAEVQAGGMASRMSSISHALRSKYL